MKESRYELIVFWDKADEIFVVDVPELLGCMTHGKTKREAIANAEAAIDLWLETAKEDGVPIPEPRGRLMFAGSNLDSLRLRERLQPTGAFHLRRASAGQAGVKRWRGFHGLSKNEIKKTRIRKPEKTEIVEVAIHFRTDYSGQVSASEIIKELPRLSETDRRAIREVLLEISNQDRDVALCNEAALDGALVLERMENDDARHETR